jgi:hypothetical protein
MKQLFKLFLPLIFLACQSTSSHEMQPKVNSENWQIITITTQNHVYNKLGLLDTTFQALNYYLNGHYGTTYNSVILRKYDNNYNLINEKNFQILKTKNIFSQESLFVYDANKNLILTTDKSNNVIDEIVKTFYNSNKQKQEEVIVRIKYDSIPKNWNADSIIAYHDNKRNLHYDTSIISYQYDQNGKLSKQIYKSPSQEVEETLTTLYSDTSKTFTYGINSRNDTVSLTKYEKQGNLIAETTRRIYDPLSTDTILYDGNKKVEEIRIDKKNNHKSKMTYKYDSKGNEIENITYK